VRKEEEEGFVNTSQERGRKADKRKIQKEEGTDGVRHCRQKKQFYDEE